MPSEYIFKNITVQLVKGNKFIIIDLPQKIEFPKEGICVIIKALSSSFYNKYANNPYAKPALKSVTIPKKAKEKMFCRFYYSNNIIGEWSNNKKYNIKQIYYIGLKMINKNSEK